MKTVFSHEDRLVSVRQLHAEKATPPSVSALQTILALAVWDHGASFTSRRALIHHRPPPLPNPRTLE